MFFPPNEANVHIFLSYIILMCYGIHFILRSRISDGYKVRELWGAHHQETKYIAIKYIWNWNFFNYKYNRFSRDSRFLCWFLAICVSVYEYKKILENRRVFLLPPKNVHFFRHACYLNMETIQIVIFSQIKSVRPVRYKVL